MTALKNKLTERIEIINSDTMSKVRPTTTGTHNLVLEQESNVIMLKNADNNSLNSIVPSFAITLNEAKERLLMLQNFVKELMIPTVDYGLIPRCEKPTLFKSGAEKLCDIFGFSKQFEITNRLEDWEKPLFHYEIKAILINKKTGLIEAEGLGCCNNKERKFKSQDGYSVINTILKMAKKRALVDAVLSATRSSGIFTQDVEDLQIESPPVQAKPEITINHVYALAKKSNISTEFIKKVLNERYKVISSSELSPPQVKDLHEYLLRMNPVNPNN